MSDYKQILEAVKDLDRWPWEIGDALLVECGPPGKKDGYALLWEAAKYLFSEGHEYDVATLSKYRSVAYWFEPSKRRSVAWAWHEAARSPEF